MRWLVDLVLLVVAVLVSPLILYSALTTGKYRRDWGQRFGGVPELPPPPEDAPRVWVHAVSMGEVNAVRGLIEAWRAAAPEVEFVVSTTTDTGQDRARKLFPDLLVVRYPLDFSFAVNRTLDRIKPDMIVLVELEVWYQFVTLAAARNIPIAVVNGRLSERSLRRFGRVAPLVRRMFSRLTWVGAQDDAYAGRFRTVGTPTDHVEVTGSLKWDTAEVADRIAGADELAAAMGIDRSRPAWVCGSTGPGEEAICLEAYRRLLVPHPGVQLVLVPRKPERFDEVAEMIERVGFACVRRSHGADARGAEAVAAGAPAGRFAGDAPPADTAHSTAAGPPVECVRVFLGDTMGELRRFYALADVVFVGRSLVNMGGSDMMEVAALARPMVVGPHNENFPDIVRRLEAGGGIRIVSDDLSSPRVAESLAEAVGTLLEDRQTAEKLGNAARQVVLDNRGATQRTLAALQRLLPKADGPET